MMVTQISDRWVFYHRALEAPALVYCCCVPGTRVEPVEEEGAVFVGTLNLYYHIDFEDKLWKIPTRWHFLEVLTPDAQGSVSLEGTLLYRLRAHDPKTVTIYHRAGSILV